MEIVLWFVGIVFIIAIIGAIVEWIEEWFGSIDWQQFLLWLIGGGVGLAILFSFTAEGVLVIIGAYMVLIVVALIAGKFKRY